MEATRWHRWTFNLLGIFQFLWFLCVTGCLCGVVTSAGLSTNTVGWWWRQLTPQLAWVGWSSEWPTHLLGQEMPAGQEMQPLEWLGLLPVWMQPPQLLFLSFHGSDLQKHHGCWRLCMVSSSTLVHGHSSPNSMVHWGLAGWPSQPNTEGPGHKPGSSVALLGNNPQMVDRGQGPAGTFFFVCILGQHHGKVLRVPKGPAPNRGISKEAHIF